MYFSGKITNSMLQFFGRELKTFAYWEDSEVPEEFVKDPTAWIEVRKVESLLRRFDEHGQNELNETNLMERVGLASAELRSWGVLDSVLRMMQKPEEIYNQPQRFLSYFISPAPPIANVKSKARYLSFELPLTYDEYPLTAEYLRSALEALPTFVGRKPALVVWRQNRIELDWSDDQEHLLDHSEMLPHLKPEVIGTVMENLASIQSQLEEKQQRILVLENQLAALAHQPPPVASDNSLVLATLKTTQESLIRLGDYLGRSQQLVTLLAGNKKEDRGIKEAMHRTDWEKIKSNYPQVINNCMQQINELLIGTDTATPGSRSSSPLKNNAEKVRQPATERLIKARGSESSHQPPIVESIYAN